MHLFLAEVFAILTVVIAYHVTGRKADRITDLRFRSYLDCPLPGGADNLPYLTSGKIQRVPLRIPAVDALTHQVLGVSVLS